MGREKQFLSKDAMKNFFKLGTWSQRPTKDFVSYESNKYLSNTNLH